ncbi:hypothetical protein BDV40DRAFT_287642 [Aspergillus tamarii]|uniref:Zn(2)-C6 fungal-type domain-containing protein n=1 Tax=Aspergillus tamarii TaxID=41984 RepID=A0A5N6V0I4_ASPTM|nr:hypothetical protein BDV40DRAFT_287642 [Aspergillus tamarii]
MVGVPHSIGCDNCRKRKKKCDNRAPACTACVASGRICPGYQKKYKFINENTSLLAHYRKKKYLLEEIGAGPDETVALSRCTRNHTYHTVCSYEWICWPLVSDREHDSANLVYILQDPTSHMIFPLRSHGGFYHYIPCRLGRNIALDSAVACLCTVYTNLMAADGTISNDAWRKYAQSLGALRLCLDDPERCFQSETIYCPGYELATAVLSGTASVAGVLAGLARDHIDTCKSGVCPTIEALRLAGGYSSAS